MDYKKTLIIVLWGIFTLVLEGCASMYKPPLDGEAHAIVKVKFDYVGVNVVGKEITALVKIKQNGQESILVYDRGIEQMKVGDGRQIPFKNPTVKIALAQNTEVESIIRSTWRGGGTVTWNQTGMHTQEGSTIFTCAGRYKFSPQTNKTYLLEYKTKDVKEGCTVSLLEQSSGLNIGEEIKASE